MFCRICGKKIPDDSVFCSYCGTTVVREKDGTAPEKVERPALKENICPVCGNALDAGDNVCPKCDFPVISLLHGTEEEEAKVYALIDEYRKEYLAKTAEEAADERLTAEKKYYDDGKVKYSFVYDANGDLVGIWWHDKQHRQFDEGILFEYEYDADGNQTKRVEYNAYWNLTNIEYKYDANGNRIEKCVYDAKGKLTHGTGYDENGRRTYEREYENGRLTLEVRYDTNGNRTEEREYDATGKLTDRRVYAYDTDGNCTEMRAYDANGKLINTYES